MTMKINDISKLFSLNQIDYIEMKQNIRSSNNISDITKAKIIEKLNENIKAISQIMKEKILKKNNFELNSKICGIKVKNNKMIFINNV